MSSMAVCMLLLNSLLTGLVETTRFGELREGGLVVGVDGEDACKLLEVGHSKVRLLCGLKVTTALGLPIGL